MSPSICGWQSGDPESLKLWLISEASRSGPGPGQLRFKFEFKKCILKY